ncbi:hypothetical protein ACIBL5_03340 [Streptomyces sp. NPDC050516]
MALMTAQNAYRQFAEDGLVEGNADSGTYFLDVKRGRCYDFAPQFTDFQ